MAGEVILPDEFKAAYENWKFAPAIRAGGMVYVSGVLGFDANATIPADVTEEIEQAFANAQIVLAAAGLDFSDIVEMTTFHIDLATHLPAFAAVKDTYFPKPYPSWTAIGISALALPGARLEMRIIALDKQL